MTTQPIYEFYAELADFEPKIWRSFQVSEAMTVARLGYIVQVLFEMRASHLMSIEIPRDENFERSHPDFPKNKKKAQKTWSYEIMSEAGSLFPPSEDVVTVDATEEKLKNALFGVGDRLRVNYDFGDDWHVDLELMKIFTDKDLPGKELPRVLEGKGFGILEDIGGVWGLADNLEITKDKKSEEYKELCEWQGIENLDLLSFDKEDLNFRLKKLPRIYKDIYELHFYPTQRSVDLIERKYLKKSSKR